MKVQRDTTLKIVGKGEGNWVLFDMGRKKKLYLIQQFGAIHLLVC